MPEHLSLGITEKFGELVEKARGSSKDFHDEGIDIQEKKSGVIAWALRLAATRVVLARNIGELSDQLTAVESSISAGGNAGEVDALRAAASLKVSNLLSDGRLSAARTSIEGDIQRGDFKNAVKFLREIEKQDENKLAGDKKKEFDVLLDSVEKLDSETSRSERTLNPLIAKVESGGDKINESAGREIVQIRKKSEAVEIGIARKEIKGVAPTKVKGMPAEGRVGRKKDEIKRIREQRDRVIDSKDKTKKQDYDFVRKLVEGERDSYGVVDSAGNIEIQMDNMEYKYAKLAYARTSVVLGRYSSQLSRADNKDLKEFLEKVQLELRERLLSVESEQKEKIVAENMMPRDDLWEGLTAEEKLKITGNFEFMERHGTAEELSKRAKLEGMSRSKSELYVRKLMSEKPDLAKKFRFTDNDIYWEGGAEDFFELCRQEIYRIKDSVPEEQLGQLMFVEQAQTYLALMGVNAKSNPEIKMAKDAVTKMLYMEFALKSLWKAGGNHEAWQRAAGLLLRDASGENFFTTMKIREKIRGVTTGEYKKDVILPGFNVDDMLTIGELEAPNGQSWLAYISTDNMVLNKKRLPEFAKALSLQAAEKARLSGRLTEAEISGLKLLKADKVQFDGEQMDWMRNYLQYMHVATLNAGEKLYLMNGVKPGDKGFDYASLPGGQFAEKSGIWGLLYYAKYQVTKYGFEGLGKLFVPNHGLLSYARMETLRHFLSFSGNEAWLGDGDNTIENGGRGGAHDFFFDRKAVDDEAKNSFLKFWEETWLDGRTGKSIKTKGMRSLANARKIGSKLMSEGAHKSFIKEMNFKQLETLIGHKIPGGDNEAKLAWVVSNLDYEMMEMRTMPSKREGDLINKYSKYYVETDTALQNFLDAPTLANKMKIIDSIVRYNNASAEDVSKMLDDFVAENRKEGIRLKEGGKAWNPLDYIIGPGVADSDQKNLRKSADGDWMDMPEVYKSITDGWYPGRGFLFTRQEYKEGTRDPMVMRKLEIQNAIAWGIVSPQEGGRMMRDWQKMIYFGEGFEVKFKGRSIKLRPGMIPVLTPFFLMRGWWVDRMGLNWEDFMMIMKKQNEETLGKLMKYISH